ncbi:GNAT family acetyltransferase [Bifidobacterium dolichotidis]|uniref:GNAT family acetyltransferase n=1 Tax=Bifidobacterium dolichotidis TaxID=2306976 RepID=A0A430FSL0_9BIFI|nr:GNAT family N-acetyltransferase [Bifidobacterium dolichotidis]RSX55853.1 GNAT family acetyltransferase [Bifidobacterium dolichotidis]
MSAQLVMRMAMHSDVIAITDIYNAAIVEGGINAQISPVSFENRETWLYDHKDPYGVFVVEAIDDATQTTSVVAFAACSEYYALPGYKGVTELAFYVAPEWRRQGVGYFTLHNLLREAHMRGLRKAICVIFADNLASMSLARSFGFRPFGMLEHAATDAKGILHDVAYYELDLI